MNVEKIAAWVAILGAVYTIAKIAARIFGATLSSEEKEVLIACAQKGEIRILSVDGWGEWVRADAKDFFDEKEPAYAAQHLEAFHRLLGRGFAKHEDGFLYRLTGTGFKVARRLADSSKKPKHS